MSTERADRIRESIALYVVLLGAGLIVLIPALVLASIEWAHRRARGSWLDVFGDTAGGLMLRLDRRFVLMAGLVAALVALGLSEVF